MVKRPCAVALAELSRTPDRNEVSSVEMRQAGTVKVNVTKHRGVGQDVIYVDVISLRAFTTAMIDRILHIIYTHTQSLNKNKMLWTLPADTYGQTGF